MSKAHTAFFVSTGKMTWIYDVNFLINLNLTKSLFFILTGGINADSEHNIIIAEKKSVGKKNKKIGPSGVT